MKTENNILRSLYSLILICVVGLLTSCNSNKLSVEGEVSGIKDQEIYLDLSLPDKNKVRLQTSQIVDGKFHFDVKLKDKASLLAINLEDEKYYVNRLERMVPQGIIMADNGNVVNVKLTVDPKNIETHGEYIFPQIDIVNPSSSFKVYQDFKKMIGEKYMNRLRATDDSLTSLNINWSEYTSMEDFPVDLLKKVKHYRASVDKINVSKNEFLKSYIEKHKADLTGLFALLELNSYMVDYINNIQAHLDIIDALEENIQNTHVAKNYKSMLMQALENRKKAAQVDVGKMFKDFTLKNTEGKGVRLSSQLKKGHFLLLDFWASWCGPCRAENPNVLKAYNEFHKKGFNIVAVSLDKKKEAWLKAIKKDNLPWLHLCDFKSRNSDVVKEYGVNGIPMNFFLNDKGEIVAKSLHGEALHETLNKMLNE